MADFEEVGAKKQYRKWKLWKEGDYITGRYQSTGTDNYDNVQYNIKITDTNIKDLNNELIFGMNSNHVLDSKMEEAGLSKGDLIQVKYNGMKVSEKSGNDWHDIRLLTADKEEAEESNTDQDIDL